MRNKVLIKIDPLNFRPTEVDLLLGDASKAKKVLNWKPLISFDQLVDETYDKMSKVYKELTDTIKK